MKGPQAERSEVCHADFRSVTHRYAQTIPLAFVNEIFCAASSPRIAILFQRVGRMHARTPYFCRGIESGLPVIGRIPVERRGYIVDLLETQAFTASPGIASADIRALKALISERVPPNEACINKCAAAISLAYFSV